MRERGTEEVDPPSGRCESTTHQPLCVWLVCGGWCGGVIHTAAVLRCLPAGEPKEKPKDGAYINGMFVEGARCEGRR